jgi:hypothetical protein
MVKIIIIGEKSFTVSNSLEMNIYIQEKFMAQTNIRMDTQLKKQSEITTETNPFYSEANMKVLIKSIKQLEEGKGVEHELIEA